MKAKTFIEYFSEIKPGMLVIYNQIIYEVRVVWHTRNPENSCDLIRLYPREKNISQRNIPVSALRLWDGTINY